MVHNIKLTVTITVIFFHIIQLNTNAAQEDKFVLIEGDMMVDEWFIEQGRQVEKRGAILMKLKSKHSYYWPGTNLPDGGRIVRIPYTLRFGFFSRLFGTGSIKAFKQAIEEYHKRTCLRFEEKTDKDSDYLEIFSGTGCWSQIGRRGGKQQLSLGKGCEFKGRALHEIMHAIGFLHEQSRKDRDQHVKIVEQNIENGKRSQFETYRQDTGNLPYDFHSIMHYSNTDFSINGQSTIQARIDPDMKLGQEGSFSALDVVRINLLYKCPQLQTDLVLYFVTVYTADVRYAGTDAKVDILLTGSKGDSGEIELQPTQSIPDPFERGSKQTFPVIVPDLGNLDSLKTRLAMASWYNWWSWNGWKLDRVEIETPDDRKKHTKLVLTYNDWIYPGDHVALKPQR